MVRIKILLVRRWTFLLWYAVVCVHMYTHMLIHVHGLFKIGSIQYRTLVHVINLIVACKIRNETLPVGENIGCVLNYGARVNIYIQPTYDEKQHEGRFLELLINALI